MLGFEARHIVLDALYRLLGMRARLRCPNCRAVGTYKPHGGAFDRLDVKGTRRWLCKWCGFYEDAGRRALARPSTERGCWVLPEDTGAPDPTPAHVVAARLGSVWPWRG